MEMALREAMERSKDKDEDQVVNEKPKPVATDTEIEDILSRTLENKVRTT
jgi:hypothetical protein